VNLKPAYSGDASIVKGPTMTRRPNTGGYTNMVAKEHEGSGSRSHAGSMGRPGWSRFGGSTVDADPRERRLWKQEAHHSRPRTGLGWTIRSSTPMGIREIRTRLVWLPEKRGWFALTYQQLSPPDSPSVFRWYKLTPAGRRDQRGTLLAISGT